MFFRASHEQADRSARAVALFPSTPLEETLVERPSTSWRPMGGYCREARARSDAYPVLLLLDPAQCVRCADAGFHVQQEEDRGLARGRSARRCSVKRGMQQRNHDSPKVEGSGRVFQRVTRIAAGAKEWTFTPAKAASVHFRLNRHIKREQLK